MEDIETSDIGQSLVDEFVDDNAIEAQEKQPTDLRGLTQT